MKILHVIEVVLLVFLITVVEINCMRLKNVEKELRAETEALRYELKETEERCRRLSYTCIDVVNRKILEKGCDYE